jgi:hypothetical protein
LFLGTLSSLLLLANCRVASRELSLQALGCFLLLLKASLETASFMFSSSFTPFSASDERRDNSADDSNDCGNNYGSRL